MSGVLQDAEVLSVFAYSMTIALASTFLSLTIGTWVACFLGPNRFRGKLIVFALTCLPAVIPGIISAISLRIYRPRPRDRTGHAGHHPRPHGAQRALRRPGGHGPPLATLPRSHIEAARDLGADAIVAFFRITLPYLLPALIGAGIFCMLLSFDDFVRSFFLGSYEPTLPVLIFAKLRSGMSPEINAISTVVLILTAILGLWAERSMRRLNKGAVIWNSEGQTIVRLDRVTKRFGEVTAIDDLDMEIMAGEFITFLGPSGCGKSTTLRILGGFEKPDAGRVIVDGEDVTPLPPNRRDVNMVFQDYALFPHMTVSQQHRLRAGTEEQDPRARSNCASASCSTSCNWRNCASAGPTSFPAVSDSAWLWPAPWRRTPSCCCWTNRSARSTPSCAARCKSS